MSLGQPQDWVRGEISIHSGMAQLWQMLLVRVTVGHPVCELEEDVVAVTVTVASSD